MSVLYIVIPCYNEEYVIPMTSMLFLKEIKTLIENNKISDESKILFVNDGSSDNTWKIIKHLCEENSHFMGISLSRNRGHQNAVIAGLMEARNKCDITISIDCDGQDDISAMDKMIDEYVKGNDIVYGVRSSRKTDSFFKRFTAEKYYKILSFMGVDIIYNHADYRLLSNRVLNELEKFKEVNLFLRGLIPIVGFNSSCVYYERKERLSGKTHYPIKKMLSLAFDGITSFSIKPIRFITIFGCFVSLISFIFGLWIIISKILNIADVFPGWASMVCIIILLSGIQILSLGIIGEYIGKIYLETKARPRYIISERSGDKND